MTETTPSAAPEPTHLPLIGPRSLAAAFVALIVVLCGGTAWGSSDVRGEVVTHVSPGGIAERCVMLARLASAVYRPEAEAAERALCAIDFHDGTHALCPKLFSTSAGTLVYDLAGGPYAGRAPDFERQICPQGHIVTHEAPAGAVSYKMSVNTRESSATFANSAFIYYHFARYFDAAVHVPPAVLRSVDKDEHLRRVARVGESVSANRPPLRMLHAGWSTVVHAAQDPASYTPTDELFTSDRRQLYGVMLRPEGRRYGEEVNGSRRSGWGDGQSRDFQQTVPFVALATDRPLAEAIRQGLAQGHGASAVPADVRSEQVAYWMRELVDITLLDHLLGQQDRIGNIDYLTHWIWVEDGRVRQRRAMGERPPAEIAAFAPKRIKRSELGDNDAGIRTSYANFTRRTGMLDRLRHYPAGTYRRLMALARDFDSRGPLHEQVRTSYGLSVAEFAHLADNLQSAAATLRANCLAGRLRFDLDPDAVVLGRAPAEAKLDCERP
jgi:hypothetical protein